MAEVPVYRGKFGEREAERLLWRAGFGPAPGQARKLARRYNLRGAVRSLTRSKAKEALRGVIGPGEDENLDTRLRRRSTYTLWCSLAGHRGLGMEASLRIKRRKRR